MQLASIPVTIAVVTGLLVAASPIAVAAEHDTSTSAAAAAPRMTFSTGWSAAVPRAGTGTSRSQRSEPCDLPLVSPPPKGADNAISCRSTKPNVKLYVTNIGDTSDCTYDIAIAWGDGNKTHLPSFPGGPSGRELLAAHDYTNAGVYNVSVAGSVVSGGCSFNGGDVQFSYIQGGTPYPGGPPISAGTMLTRATDWISAMVPYSQASYYSDLNGTYRQDCSGFVSMAWDLDTSPDTPGLRTVATKVAAGLSGIEPGDIILKAKTAKAHGHVFLFVSWDNGKHTIATVDEETGKKSSTPYAVTKSLGIRAFKGFVVYKYNERR